MLKWQEGVLFRATAVELVGALGHFREAVEQVSVHVGMAW